LATLLQGEATRRVAERTECNARRWEACSRGADVVNYRVGVRPPRSSAMMRAGLCAVAFAIAFTPARAAEPKAVNLSALRDAVETAAKKGENVDDVRKALEAV